MQRERRVFLHSLGGAARETLREILPLTNSTGQKCSLFTVIRTIARGLAKPPGKKTERSYSTLRLNRPINRARCDLLRLSSPLGRTLFHVFYPPTFTAGVNYFGRSCRRNYQPAKAPQDWTELFPRDRYEGFSDHYMPRAYAMPLN